MLIDVLDTTLLYFTLLYFAYSAYLLLLLLCLRTPLIYSLLSILFYSIYSILFYSILFYSTLLSTLFYMKWGHMAQYLVIGGG